MPWYAQRFRGTWAQKLSLMDAARNDRPNLSKGGHLHRFTGTWTRGAVMVVAPPSRPSTAALKYADECLRFFLYGDMIFSLAASA